MSRHHKKRCCPDSPVAEAMNPASVEEALGMNLVPTVYGRPVEWRMFYHGEPTDVEPTRRRT